MHLIFILILFQEIRQDACKKGEIIIWLKSRLVALSEVSSENEVKKQGDELSVLASDFKKILALLTEVYYNYIIFTPETVLFSIRCSVIENQ